MGSDAFRLGANLDAEALASVYRSRRRIQIPGFLDPGCAERLLAELRSEKRWTLIFNQGDKLFELNRTARSELTPEQLGQLDLAVHKGARDGFQYRFENIRVPDGAAEREASGTLLDSFAQFLSSEPVLSLFKQITGENEINLADAQATAYGPGHFLTAHDDDVAGKNRRAAYVFGLTPAWNLDWGGLLLFHGADGQVGEALGPAFNTLNLFTVPQPHSVSMVTPFVPRRRYSVTGWLRAL